MIEIDEETTNDFRSFAVTGACPRVCSARDSLPQSATRDPQVGQREQRVQLRRVLRQPAIPDLDVAELAFDDAQRMLNPGADSGLDVLDVIRDGVLRIAPVEQAAQAA